MFKKIYNKITNMESTNNSKKIKDINFVQISVFILLRCTKDQGVLFSNFIAEN